MSRLQEINPLLVLGLFSLAFLAFGTISRNLINILWGLVALFLVCLLLLPGGRQLGQRTAKLPDISQRARCLVDSIADGAPFTRAAGKEPSCRYQASGFLNSR